MNDRILKAIAVVAELSGTELSKAALLTMEADLSEYPEQAALRALDRFRKESKFRLTLAAIIELIEQEDGRPSADEAWAMCPRSEEDSVFWNDEIQTAMGIARPVLDSGDKVGARMAFRDAYERLVREARAQNRRPDWSLSLGWDKAGRAVAVTKAVASGLISQQAAQQYLPAPDVGLAALIEGRGTTLSLTNTTPDEQETVKRGIAMVRDVFEKANQRNADERARQEEGERQRRADIEAERTRQLSMADERLKQESGEA